MAISTLAWVLVGIGGWLVAGLVIAFGFARFLRLREERIGQDRPPVPKRPAAADPAPAAPTPRDAMPAEEPAPGDQAPPAGTERPAPHLPQQRRPVRGRRPRIGPSSRRG